MPRPRGSNLSRQSRDARRIRNSANERTEEEQEIAREQRHVSMARLRASQSQEQSEAARETTRLAMQNRRANNRGQQIDNLRLRTRDLTSADLVVDEQCNLHDNTERKIQSVGHFSQDVTSINFAPVIKTEILDPSEQNQEFILPDYPTHVPSIDAMYVVESEIQDSPKTNKFLLPNIKVELTEIEEVLDKPSGTEYLPESFIKSEIENSSTFGHKLTESSVLLHDCLISENLSSISAKLKSFKTNTEILKPFPLTEFTPFFPHISEAYKEMAFPVRRNSTPNHEIRSKYVKKKNCSEKYDNKIRSYLKPAISMENRFDENYSESTQQLCLTSDYKLPESTEKLIKEVFLFDPDFGKITCGINQIQHDF